MNLQGKETEVLALVKSGLSYAQTAKAFGATRNQIAGIVSRARQRGEFEAVKLSVAANNEVINDTIEREGSDNNHEQITTKGVRITTLDQLLKACEVDLDVWIVDRYVVNKWEVGAKDDNGHVVVEPLYQVKAWLKRKVVEAIKPAIASVSFPALSPAVYALQKKQSALKSCLIIPDTQIGYRRDFRSGKLVPFHDRSAMAAVLAIAEELRVDQAVFVGDVMDWSGWSDKYVREPAFYATTQPALIETAWYIAQVKARARRAVYIDGNHEVRLYRMLMTHLADAYGLSAADNVEYPALSIDNLLGLSRMGVEYIGGYPDSEYWINDRARVVHGDAVKGGAGKTAAAMVEKISETTIFGHIHRAELATKNVANAGRDGGVRSVSAFSPGCLCHTDGRVPGSRREDNWQQGAAIVWYNDESAVIEPIRIDGGRYWFRGQVQTAEDYVSNLRKDVGEQWGF